MFIFLIYVYIYLKIALYYRSNNTYKCEIKHIYSEKEGCCKWNYTVDKLLCVSLSGTILTLRRLF